MHQTLHETAQSVEGFQPTINPGSTPDAANPPRSANGNSEPPLGELERELPVVYDGQIPLGDLISRVVQAIYAELTEMAETMPNMSDSARKRVLADWVVKTKKQVVKLYAIAKWSRDADAVQKCMNITAFLMTQNQQFEGAITGLKYARDSLDPARLRNHDLLTSLDVLTTGTYLRLPSCIKKSIIPPIPLTDSDIAKTLSGMENTIRYRLRMSEFIPVQMSKHRIADGRVFFTVPKLFETSLSLRGAECDQGWFFVHVEFLINIGGDLDGLQEFPRVPSGIMKRHITDEADARLAFYLPLPQEANQPPRPRLSEGVVDAPLVRLYNFLQMMSLSYQLEILRFQAERMRSLGWADYLAVVMSPDRKTLTASYWMRPSTSLPPNRQRPRLPSSGGTLTISMIGTGPESAPSFQSYKFNVSKLQQKSKIGGAMLSDEVETLRLVVHWQPANGTLGVNVPLNEFAPFQNALFIDANNLDFEALLLRIIRKHINIILKFYQFQLLNGPTKKVFVSAQAAAMIKDGDHEAINVHLYADEYVVLSIDARTGRMNLRDTGGFAAPGRGPRFSVLSDRLNETPMFIFDTLVRLRLNTITDMVEQKAKYLGLETFRRRNFPKEELVKLGPSAWGTLYIQLTNFPNHYLVLVIRDDEFRYALITTKVLTDSVYQSMVMEDIAWLDIDRMHKTEFNMSRHSHHPSPNDGNNTRQDTPGSSSGFQLNTPVLRDLYSYCCARVAYMNVERQLKLRGIPFTHVNPGSEKKSIPMELAYSQSSLVRSIPALCVESKDILAGAPAAEAAMPNIRIVPLHWWSNKTAQVVTSVKLKYVQQPMGKKAGTSTVIRPSKSIIYDTTEAVVSFLSEDVNSCVDEFFEEWARVSKMVVIAREVAQMTKDQNRQDMRLLCFDLQTVEFVYALDYTVSITCMDQLSPTGGKFDLQFSRCSSHDSTSAKNGDLHNPHEAAELFFQDILRQGQNRLSQSIQQLVLLLRDTLPIVMELEEIRLKIKDGQNVDIYAKGVEWYRILYRDFRYALDFRLMADRRVAIMDGSWIHSSSQSTESGWSRNAVGDDIGLRPMPEFQKLAGQAIASANILSGVSSRRLSVLDVGIICDKDLIANLGRNIHAKILERQQP